MPCDPEKPVNLQAWPPEPEGYSGGHGRSLWQFESPSPLGDKAIWLMIGTIVTGLIYAVIKSGESNPPGISDALTVLAASTFDLAVVIAYQIFFYMWVYRVCTNLRAFGAEGLSISPGWAVGYFFIPILNFFKPYQSMRDAWQASTPGLDLQAKPESWWHVHSDPKVAIWWAVNVLEPVIGITCGLLLINSEITYLGLAWIFMAMRVAKVVVTIFFITALTARQEETARRLRG